MYKVTQYLLSVLYYFCFGSLLLIFHVLQWIALKGLGYNAHKNVVDFMNFLILRCLNLLGTRITFENNQSLPLHRPLIFVVNHQSTYDIPPLIWYLRKYHAKFISKHELGRGIPSVSFNLRHGGSVLIDRNNRTKALEKISAFGKRIARKNHAAVLFPEGTRSRDENVKKFQRGGLSNLMESMPTALLVPIRVRNSWKLAQHNYFPFPLGVHLKFKVYPPLAIDLTQKEQIIIALENTIRTGD